MYGCIMWSAQCFAGDLILPGFATSESAGCQSCPREGKMLLFDSHTIKFWRSNSNIKEGWMVLKKQRLSECEELGFQHAAIPKDWM